MNRLTIPILFACLTAFAATSANADTPYTVTSSVTAGPGGDETFGYSVTNNDQGSGPNNGFDGFEILIPTNAILVSDTVPPSYSSGGSWEFRFAYGAINISGLVTPPAPQGYQWANWFGVTPASVYPAGETATFSVTLSNVGVGSGIGEAVTYIYPYSYSGFNESISSPISAVPEPGTDALFLAGLGVIGMSIRRRKAAWVAAPSLP